MPKKLLLADDSVTIQKVISITFASDEYELVVVGDGDSAIAKAKEVSPDIILADVAMPGKNGYEVCEAIKADAALSSVPVMLLAGTFEPLDSAEAARVKADDSIVKPFESQELIDKVNSLLANSFSAGTGHSAESSFEVPDEDFGADDIPGIEESGEAEADLDFLEGGIFEEPAAQSVATSHVPFVDLDVTDEELTSEELTPEVLDISAQTGAESIGEGGTDFGIIDDADDSNDAFSFEPAAESLEVEELEPVELESAGGFEGTGAAADPAGTKSEPSAVEPAMESVDFSAPDIELESGTPELVNFGDIAAPIEEPEAVAEETQQLVEQEPAAEQAAISEESIDSLDGDFNAESEAAEVEEEPLFITELEPAAEPEPVELYEAALEELEPEAAHSAPVESVVEAATEAVTEQSIDAVEAATASITDSLSAEKVEEIVARVAREIIEKVAWEVVPELAEELINAEIKKFKSIMMQSK